jgi:methylated-DNA-[protein]-cysteine S-methyltransferase
MLVSDESALIGLYFVGCDHLPDASHRWKLNAEHPVLQLAAKQLEEYFSRKRKVFSLPLRLAGTGFQQRVWREIALVPYGKTITYTELAKRIGASHAIRAVGTTTSRNPVSIIVPCHRVVGKNGSLCGFAGGLERKRYLLELENLECGDSSPLFPLWRLVVKAGPRPAARENHPAFDGDKSPAKSADKSAHSKIVAA